MNNETALNEIDYDDEEYDREMNVDLNMDFGDDIPEELDLPDLTSLSDISGDLQLDSFDKSIVIVKACEVKCATTVKS